MGGTGLAPWLAAPTPSCATLWRWASTLHGRPRGGVVFRTRRRHTASRPCSCSRPCAQLCQCEMDPSLAPPPPAVLLAIGMGVGAEGRQLPRLSAEGALPALEKSIGTVTGGVHLVCSHAGKT